jgi:hypothetical protein
MREVLGLCAGDEAAIGKGLTHIMDYPHGERLPWRCATRLFVLHPHPSPYPLLLHLVVVVEVVVVVVVFVVFSKSLCARASKGTVICCRFRKKSRDTGSTCSLMRGTVDAARLGSQMQVPLPIASKACRNNGSRND